MSELVVLFPHKRLAITNEKVYTVIASSYDIFRLARSFLCFMTSAIVYFPLMRWCILVRILYKQTNPPESLDSLWAETRCALRSSGERTIISPTASSSAPTFNLDSKS